MTALVLMVLLLPAARCAGLEEELGLDRLREAAGAYLEGYLDVSSLGEDGVEKGIGAVVEGGRRALPGALRTGVSRGALLLAIALVCGVAREVGKLGEEGLDPVRLAGAAAVCAVGAADVNSLMAQGRQALEQLKAFSDLLLPTVTAACAAGGAPAAAVARQGAVLLFFDLLVTLAHRLLLPLVYAYVAAVTGAAALGNRGLKRLAGLIRWGCTALLTALLTLFVSYLTFTGAVAGGADVLAQKAAKTALSGMIPVVGGILSDAAETVVAGAGVVRGAAGVVGLAAVLAICLTPFLHLGCHYLAYKCAAALAATAAPGPAAELMDDLGSAFALVLGAVGGGGIILYVALVTAVRTVSG